MSVTTQVDLQTFLDEIVNLKRDDLLTYRAQVNNLREQLGKHITANPEFGLVKMLHSGSAAKGTAISTLNDMDVAVYLRPEKVPDHELPHVLSYVRDLLIKVYHQMTEEQFKIGRHAVQVKFKTSGLDVDVVPVIPNGKADDRGDLATHGTRDWVETSVPLHLQFIRTRDDRHPNFRPLVRLTKWWREAQEIKFKSFLIELLWAHTLDTGAVDGGDLQEAMLGFFAYIVRSGLEERVSFTDYYKDPSSTNGRSAVEVFDPVNPDNNVADGVDMTRRAALVRSAEEALNNVAAAQTAHTRERARTYYQRVFGPRYAV